MKWQLVDQWHAISDCGRYRVSRAIVSERDWFDAWFGTLEGGNLRHLYGGRDKRSAMRACESDAVKMASASADMFDQATATQ